MSNWSYWERSFYFDNIDCVVIGCGIVGLNAAISLKEKNPDLKVAILERSYLPSGASTKNAGFAIFGSPSELLEDLKFADVDTVFSLARERYDGLLALRTRVPDKVMEFEETGVYELQSPNFPKAQVSQSDLDFLNEKIYDHLELKKCYTFKDELLPQFGLGEFERIIENPNEGILNPVKMINHLIQKAQSSGVLLYFGMDVGDIKDAGDEVVLSLKDGVQLRVKSCLLCTNGHTKKLLPTLHVSPHRNLVMTIKPEYPLKCKGGFQLDRGFVYFRNVKEGLLIGGGRNMDLKGEATDQFGVNPGIKEYLEDIVNDYILPGQTWKHMDIWSGILGFGNNKQPLVEMHSRNVGVAVRLGGIGVAIGTSVGHRAAEMMLNNIEFQ